MSKIIHNGFALLLLLSLGNSSGNYAAASATATAARAQLKQTTRESQFARRSLDEGGTGVLQKMIVENGTVTMELDLNRVNGIRSARQRAVRVQFAVAAKSFFSILVFNDLLRGPEQGSMALIPQQSIVLPSLLGASIKQLIVEKLPSGQLFDLAVRDAKTSFTFFNIEGHAYDYDAQAQLLSIHGGRLLISDEFARALGRPEDAGVVIGKISVGAAMQPLEVTQLINGEIKSVVMTPLGSVDARETPTLVPGPDVIVGELPEMAQYGNDTVNHLVGLGVGTISCNAGDQPLDWFALSNTDHPVIPQNFYRMSGGATNTDRFEQIGQSWLKHAFAAASGDACGFGCNGVGGSQLGAGCSDPYGSGLNAGQTGLGSRAWVNPFTGVFPSNSNNHTGHVHTAVSHRVAVNVSDLDTTMNPGATYYAEAQYVTPHEYVWCQSHPGQCNMYNNASYRQFTVSGTTSFSFSPVGNTVRMTPAINAWTGATINTIEPVPGTDGRAFIAYKVANPSAGVWHYEYAISNQNLDRGIQSFSVPLGCGA